MSDAPANVSKCHRNVVDQDVGYESEYSGDWSQRDDYRFGWLFDCGHPDNCCAAGTMNQQAVRKRRYWPILMSFWKETSYFPMG